MIVKRYVDVDLLLEKWKKKLDETITSSEVYTLYSDLYDVLKTYRERELQGTYELLDKDDHEDYVIDDVKEVTLHTIAHKFGDLEDKRDVMICYRNCKDPKIEIVKECDREKYVIRFENPDAKRYVGGADNEV